MLGKKSLPMTAVVVILLVALATMGVAYGLWAKTLYINGTVNTGNVDAEFSGPVFWDEEAKDVGTCEAWLSATNQANDTLNILITNGYPSYWCFVAFDVHNTGSIPIHVHQPELAAPPEVTVLVDGCYAQDTQLHYSEQAWCQLKIHVEQGAAQGASYTFGGTIFVHQYNEEP